jgi:hypothetical protein
MGQRGNREGGQVTCQHSSIGGQGTALDSESTADIEIGRDVGLLAGRDQQSEEEQRGEKGRAAPVDDFPMALTSVILVQE